MQDRRPGYYGSDGLKAPEDILFFKETKGKGKRPAKGHQANEDEPKSKKAKTESSADDEELDEESNNSSDGGEDTDFSCSATDR